MTNMERLHQWNEYFVAAISGCAGEPTSRVASAALMADMAMAEYEKRLTNARAHLAA